MLKATAFKMIKIFEQNRRISNTLTSFNPVLCLSKLGTICTLKINKSKDELEFSWIAFAFALLMLALCFLHILIIPSVIIYTEKVLIIYLFLFNFIFITTKLIIVFRC